MKVLNIGHHYHLKGGSDRYMFALEKLLREKGHAVVPFAAESKENKDTPWARYFPQGVNVKSPSVQDAVRFLYSPTARRHMQQLLTKTSPDVAHLHIYYGQLTAAILKPLKRADMPVIQTLHEYKLTCPVYTHRSNGSVCEACQGKHFWRALVRRCNQGSFSRSLASMAEAYLSRALGDVRKVDHFIAVSNFVRKKMIEHGVVTPEKVTTVHNFLDPSGFQQGTSKGKYFLYVGRLEPSKGIDILIEAAAALTEVPLVIVGKGSQRKALERLVEQKDLQHVCFLGFRQGEELRSLIKNSICTVAPSTWYETFGLTLLESFAHSRPVIASDIGGMPEVVTDGQDGFLVQPGETQQLRNKLVWMADHREQALAMGRQGRQKVEQQFGPEKHYEQIQHVYRKVTT